MYGFILETFSKLDAGRSSPATAISLTTARVVRVKAPEIGIFFYYTGISIALRTCVSETFLDL